MPEHTERPSLRIECSIETPLSPAGVIDSLIDFSPRRPEMWPNLDASKFRVHELGADSAVVTEGSAEPDIYARERYAWTEDHVTAVVLESDFCRPGGSLEYRVSAADDGASRVDVVWQRAPSGPAYEPMFEMMREHGESVLRTHLGGNWNRLAEDARDA